MNKKEFQCLTYIAAIQSAVRRGEGTEDSHWVGQKLWGKAAKLWDGEDSTHETALTDAEPNPE